MERESEGKLFRAFNEIIHHAAFLAIFESDIELMPINIDNHATTKGFVRHMIAAREGLAAIIDDFTLMRGGNAALLDGGLALLRESLVFSAPSCISLRRWL